MKSLPFKTCPVCGARALKAVHGDANFRIKGRRVIVPNLDFLRCSACGEEIFDSASSRQIDAYLAEKRKITPRRKSA